MLVQVCSPGSDAVFGSPGSWTAWASGTGWAECRATTTRHSRRLVPPRHRPQRLLPTCQGRFAAFQLPLLDAACLVVTNLAWETGTRVLHQYGMIVSWSDKGMCCWLEYLPAWKFLCLLLCKKKWVKKPEERKSLQRKGPEMLFWSSAGHKLGASPGHVRSERKMSWF